MTVTPSGQNKLKKLVKKVDTAGRKSPEMVEIRILHADCRRELRSIFNNDSRIDADWASISFEWSMPFGGVMADERFLFGMSAADKEYYGEHYSELSQDYWDFCDGCITLMRDMLLEYLSKLDQVTAPTLHEQQVVDRSFPSLGFIDDPNLKRFCQQSLKSARICNGQGLHLSAVVLAGSALEGILLSIAEQRKDICDQVFTRLEMKPKTKANWNLGLLLIVGKEAGWITESGGFKLGDALRDYRNLIHPAKHISDNARLGTPDFNASWAAVQKVSDEIEHWRQEDTANLGDESPTANTGEHK